MQKAVVIGAGQTGRGFIAPILKKNNYELVFVDKDEALIQQLQKEKRYTIEYFEDKKPPCVIDHFIAYTTAQPETVSEIASADLIITSIFASNIKDIIPMLKEAITKKNTDEEMKIICCENGVNVKQSLIDAKVNAVISEGLIFCTTLRPASDSLQLVCEDYPTLPICAVKGLTLHIDGMPIEANFHDLIQRKIYTYNFLSAVVAYLGSYMGYEVYGDAANNKTITAVINLAIPRISRVIAKKYGVPYKVQLEFTNRAVQKFKNKEIHDTIYRNCRQAERKLGKNERLLIPLKLAYEYKENTELFQCVVAASIFYGKAKEGMDIKRIMDMIHDMIADQMIENGISNYISMFEKRLALDEIVKCLQ